MQRRIIGVLTALALVSPTPVSPARAGDAGVVRTELAIPMADGVTLGAIVTVPRTPGPHPLVLFPSAWDQSTDQSMIPAGKAARRGYVTISVAMRGFTDSGGEIDVAGPATVGDITSLIDWAGANTGADVDRVGIVGLSYAAGISLLAAARDPRIRAVVAMSGWADLERAYYPNRTRAEFAIRALYNSASSSGRPSADMTRFYHDFLAFKNEDVIRAYAKDRSPATYVADYRRTRPAIMIAEEWNDLAYAPDQIVDLYESLPSPKRLELRPGDHISQSSWGMAGLDNQLWKNVYRWLDAHVLGEDPTGIAQEPPVLLQPRTGGGLRPVETYPSWAAVPGTARRFPLDGTLPTGRMTAGTWSRTITHAHNHALTRDTVFLSHLREVVGGEPPRSHLGLVDRDHALVWRGEPLGPGLTRIRGRARLHLTITPHAPAGTLHAYLFDIDPTDPNKALLIRDTPYTWHALPPNTPFPLNLTFPDTAYDLKPGHRLGLALSTHDVLFRSENPPNIPLTFSSPPTDQSHLDIPIRP